MSQGNEFWAGLLGRVMMRDIVAGIIIMLCLQLAGTVAYFNAKLDACERRIQAVEGEKQRCVEEAMQRFKAMEEQYMKMLHAANERQDGLEKMKKRKR